MRTYTPKPADITRAWHVVDADGLVLGRLATEVAAVLRGKHKPTFAPHMDTGDHVVVINTDKVVLTSGKAEAKMSYRHSGYPGGLTATSYADLMIDRSDDVVRDAIRGMLPKNRLGRQMATKLKVYRGDGAPPHRPEPGPPRDPRGTAHGIRPQRRLSPPTTRPHGTKEPPVTAPICQTTGRRKQAVARVRIRPGQGAITCNGHTFEEYFTSATHRMIVTEPLRLTDTTESWDIDVTIDGGGVSGQAGAFRLGIARALLRARPRAARHAQEGGLPHP